MSPVIEPWCIVKVMYSSVVYAGSIDYFLDLENSE